MRRLALVLLLAGYLDTPRAAAPVVIHTPMAHAPQVIHLHNWCTPDWHPATCTSHGDSEPTYQVP